MTDHLRIREGDVLSTMHLELCRQAAKLKPWQADEREQFISAARQVLNAVEDRPQRLAWSLQLKMLCDLSLNLHGVPGEFDIQELWKQDT